MRKITKKETRLIEFSTFLLLFIVGLCIPENVTEYAWVQNLVFLVRSVLPAVSNLYFNSEYPPFFAVYYALLLLISLFFLLFYFFVDRSVLIDLKKFKAIHKEKYPTGEFFRYCFLFLLFGIVYLFLFILYGEAERHANYRSVIFDSFFGAITFANVCITWALPKGLHALVLRAFYIYKLFIKKN